MGCTLASVSLLKRWDIYQVISTCISLSYPEKNSARKEFKMDSYGSLYQSRKGLFKILNLLWSLSLDAFLGIDLWIQLAFVFQN